MTVNGGTNSSHVLSLTRGTYGSSTQIILNGAARYSFFDIDFNGSVTFNGTPSELNLTATRFNGSVTFPSIVAGRLQLSQQTLTVPIVITSQTLILNETVNIPSSSVFTASGFEQTGQLPVYNNKFRVNLDFSVTKYLTYASTTRSTVNWPDFYVTGSVPGIVFGDNETYNFLTCSSMDTTGYTGGEIFGQLYVKTALVQSYTYPAPIDIVLPLSSSGTLTLNTTSINIFSDTNPTGNVNINIISPTLNVRAFYCVGQSVRSCSINLNSCIMTVREQFLVSTSNGPYPVNAGTSTIVLSNGFVILTLFGQTLNNLVINSGTYQIAASYIANISNAAQPATARFISNLTFGTFNLNGQAGALIAVNSGVNGTPRTLTKGTPWTLANSIDDGNNSGITFGETGNNQYLRVQDINGVYVPVASSAFFAFF
jgi:hypothetical protein